MIELLFKDYDSTTEFFRLSDPDVVPRVDDCIVVYDPGNDSPKKWYVKGVTHTYFVSSTNSDRIVPDVIVVYITTRG